jgi:hypothetical protein
MKYLILILLSSSLWSQTYWKQFEEGDDQKKSELIYLVKNVLVTMEKDDTYELVENNPWLKFKLIEDAFAQEIYDCFNGGWPSVKAIKNGKTRCLSPQLKNDLYQRLFKDTCLEGEFLCSPLLFGEKICVSNKTTEEKQTVFSRCENNFKTKKRSNESVLKYLKDKDLTKELKAVFDLVESICEKNSFQRETPMCKKLKARASSLKESAKNIDVNPQKIVKPENKKLTAVEVKPVISIIESTKEEVQEKLATKTECLPDGPKTPVVPVEKILSEIKQDYETPDDYCFSNESGTGKEKYSLFKESNNELGGSLQEVNVKYPDGKIQVEGFSISADQFSKAFEYVEDSKTPEDYYTKLYSTRSFDIDFDGRGKEFTISIADFPVKEKFDANGKLTDRYTSTDMRLSLYTFFPRNVLPKYNVVNEEIEVTLPTGEKMIFDKNTGKVKESVFKEVPSSNYLVNKGSSTLRYPDKNLSYQGDGMWIESKINSQDERRPGHKVTVRSRRNGKVSTCELKSEDIWEFNSGFRLPLDHPKRISSGYRCVKLKLKTDEDYYKIVKDKCPSFIFPKLVNP